MSNTNSDTLIKQDSKGNYQIVDRTIWGGIFGNDSKRTFTRKDGKWYFGNTLANNKALEKYNKILKDYGIDKETKGKNLDAGTQRRLRNVLKAVTNGLSEDFIQKNTRTRKRTIGVKKQKPVAKKQTATKPSSSKPSTTTSTTQTTEQSTQQPAAQVVTQQPVQQVVQQPTQQSSEQFLGAPFVILDENMLNGSSVRDYDTLLDYMYNNPNSSFTKGFMNMIYSNMGSTLDYWNPNQESQWDYLRRNKEAIEKIAGIRGRYGDGLLGTSGDYQDLIRAINEYAKEANRGIMYNKPQQQGYTFYNVYPNQQIPVIQLSVSLPTVTPMVSINGENVLLGQGWGVRNGQVYDQTGRLRTWSPVEQRFLKEGGTIPKYAGGSRVRNLFQIGKANTSAFTDLGFKTGLLDDKGQGVDNALGNIQKAINQYFQNHYDDYLRYKILEDNKWGNQTLFALKHILELSKQGGADGNGAGNVFYDIFNLWLEPKATEAGTKPTGTQTETLTRTQTGTLTGIQRAPTFTSKDVYHIKNDSDLLNEIGKGSAIGLGIYRAMLNRGLYNPTVNGDFYTWANSPEGLGYIKGTFNLNGKRFRRNWLGIGTTDQDDLVNGLNEANNVFNSRFVDSERRNNVYNSMNGLYGFSNSKPTSQTLNSGINKMENTAKKFVNNFKFPDFSKAFNNINKVLSRQPQKPDYYLLLYTLYQQGGQLTEDQKKEKEEFAQFLVEKSGAKTQKELESFIKEQGEEGMKKLYTEFKNKKKQKARHGAKLTYINYLKFQPGGRIYNKQVEKIKDNTKDPNYYPKPNSINSTDQTIKMLNEIERRKKINEIKKKKENYIKRKLSEINDMQGNDPSRKFGIYSAQEGKKLVRFEKCGKKIIKKGGKCGCKK